MSVSAASLQVTCSLRRHLFRCTHSMLCPFCVQICGGRLRLDVFDLWTFELWKQKSNVELSLAVSRTCHIHIQPRSAARPQFLK